MARLAFFLILVACAGFGLFVNSTSPSVNRNIDARTQAMSGESQLELEGETILQDLTITERQAVSPNLVQARKSLIGVATLSLSLIVICLAVSISVISLSGSFLTAFRWFNRAKYIYPDHETGLFPMVMSKGFLANANTGQNLKLTSPTEANTMQVIASGQATTSYAIAKNGKTSEEVDPPLISLPE